MKLSAIVFTVLLFQCSRSHVVLINRAMSRMIQFANKSPFCFLYTDRDFINDTLSKTARESVKVTSDEELDELQEMCQKKEIEKGPFSYPGTKWCGPGSSAKSYSDLGKHRLVDMCCREHDNCPQALPAGECIDGLCNKSLFTRSHCDCDDAFKKCLRDVNSETANTLGAVFFNVVQVVCFRPQSLCSGRGSPSLIRNNLIDPRKPRCGYEFAIQDKYTPQKNAVNFGTTGEVVESYFNKLLKTVRLL